MYRVPPAFLLFFGLGCRSSPSFDLGETESPDHHSGLPDETDLPRDTAPLEDTNPCVLTHPAATGAVGTSVLSTDLAQGRFLGLAPDTYVGKGIAALDDLDGDGNTDYAITAKGAGTDGEIYIIRHPLLGDESRDDAETVLVPPSKHVFNSRLKAVDVTAGTGRELAAQVYRGNERKVGVAETPIPEGSVAFDELPLVLFENDLGHSATLLPPTVGDVNGDGILDTVIAAESNSVRAGSLTPASLVAVHYGPLQTSVRGIEGDADATFRVREFEDLQDIPSGGLSMAAIPDVDGDGAADILIGVHSYPDEGTVAWGPGALVLWTGATAPGAYTKGSETAVIEGTCESLLAADPQGPVGDLTGNGRVDVATGAHNTHSPGYPDQGAVFILSELPTASGILSIVDVSGAIILGRDAFDYLGDFAPLGDLDGDQYDDLAVGARFAGGRGEVYIFLGPLSGVISAEDADLTISGTADDEFFGSILATLEDGDGDGIQDLIVGAFGSDYNGSSSGAVYYFSGADMLAAMP